MKTIFIANRNLNHIRERELAEEVSEIESQVIIKPRGQECRYVTKSGPVNSIFDTYDKALAWIKAEHLRSIAKLESELGRMKDKHKHPVKFYPKE
jgi:hypothetical protein